MAAVLFSACLSESEKQSIQENAEYYFQQRVSVAQDKMTLENFEELNPKRSRIIDEEYKEGIFVGYRGVEKYKTRPLFAFGHGLSYTTFRLGKAQADKNTISGDEPLHITLSVTNTGRQAGAEVVQLYLRDVKASVERPAKELKAFEKVYLQPGESRDVTFTVDRKALSFYDETRAQWTAEPGAFEALVGTSSAQVSSKVKFTLVE